MEKVCRKTGKTGPEAYMYAGGKRGDEYIFIMIVLIVSNGKIILCRGVKL